RGRRLDAAPRRRATPRRGRRQPRPVRPLAQGPRDHPRQRCPPRPRPRRRRGRPPRRRRRRPGVAL
ncbi:MAG: hypothetical protein AVDCRST_MAG88-1923, partial [uncultured Thermomicrobiales bacterium]